MISHHQVRGLQWAMPGVREDLPRSRPRGAKAAGLRYEREIARVLGPRAQHGQWIRFRDSGGIQWAQPDFLLEAGKHAGRRTILVLESKYTWTPEGHSQLSGLYLPLVQAAWHCQAVGVVVCKVLRPETPSGRIHSTLAGAAAAALGGAPTPILHLPVVTLEALGFMSSELQELAA